jgi:hypothetical protein
MSTAYRSLSLGMGAGVLRVRYIANGDSGGGNGVWLPCGVTISSYFAAV